MKHSDIRLSSLKTYADHDKAISDIESNYRNYNGGLTRWNSGYETILTEPARKKIAAINARMQRLFPVCESCAMSEHASVLPIGGEHYCLPCIEHACKTVYQ